MTFWIRRFAAILGAVTFFIILAISIDLQDPLGLGSLVLALIKAGVGASMFWFAGFIAGDILFKGVVTDMDTKIDDMLEGGLIQRVHEHKEKSVPGGEELPFVEEEERKEVVVSVDPSTLTKRVESVDSAKGQSKPEER